MIVLRYETLVSEFKKHPAPYIFLAGPTVRGHQEHLQPSWRFAAIDEFREREFQGTLIVPEFTNTMLSDKGKHDIPLWEFEGLKLADCILFWVARTRELIGLTTNFELGYWLRMRHKVVYGRPDEAYRIDYLDILWKRDYIEHKVGTPAIHNKLAAAIEAALALTLGWSPSWPLRYVCSEGSEE